MRKFIILLSLSLYFMTAALCGQALGAGSGYAWSETSGWVNFGPTNGGVTAYDTYLTGYAWAENIGWVKLGSNVSVSGHYENTTAANWGVNRSGANLSGYAWSETAGWINFHPAHSHVTINSATGDLDGYAWAENIGWIHFRNSTPAYGAVAGIVSYTVTTTATNGTITSTNNPTVNHGTTTTVTGSANANYYFTGVSGCGGTPQSNTNQIITTFSYTTGAITANCTVAATFAIKTYTVIPSSGAGGTINPNTPQTVNHGATTTFTVTPNAGYIASVGGCGGSLVNNTYTTSAIIANCTIAATFNLTYSISGKVTIRALGAGSGAPISGVTMTLSGAASGTTTTDGNGDYTFSGLANGAYTVTPSRAGYVFTPMNRSVNINNANVTGQNFTGTITGSTPTFSISGTITSGGSPLAGVSVALTGASNATAVTNVSGGYTFAGLSNGNYTVTPSLAGFTFAPVNRAVTINNANVTGQDFIGTGVASIYSISGTVRTRVLGFGSGTPISGVTITLRGAASGTTTTDGNGNYTFSGLANGNYTVIPSQTGFTFSPAGRAVMINNTNATGQNFTRN